MLLDTSITPAEFPDFPAGRAVPAKMRIKLHGIHGCPVANMSSSQNGFYTTFLKLIREREVLLDEDRRGIPFGGYKYSSDDADYSSGESLIGCGGEIAGGLTEQNTKDPLWFDPPLVFESGEELLVYLTWAEQGTIVSMDENRAAVDLILEVERL
ncbi:hypothetical protein ES705_18525 [subsurface metagenome]